jgi:hypothetical protein
MINEYLNQLGTFFDSTETLIDEILGASNILFTVNAYQYFGESYVFLGNQDGEEIFPQGLTPSFGFQVMHPEAGSVDMSYCSAQMVNLSTSEPIEGLSISQDGAYFIVSLPEGFSLANGDQYNIFVTLEDNNGLVVDSGFYFYATDGGSI